MKSQALFSNGCKQIWIEAGIDMEEIEKEISVEIDERKYLLRFWAINYGTHVGSTIKMVSALNEIVLIELSFETHWNAAGRYILRIGGAKSHESFAGAGYVIAMAGANVIKKYADLFSTAKSLNDIFAQVKANANALLWAAGASLADASPGV